MEAEELKQGAQGFQGEAHKARQAWFESLRQAHRAHAVLTAHHADDQAETWLLQAMRNANPLSLRGMLPWDGRRLKPLLQVPKRELEAYAKAHIWHGVRTPATPNGPTVATKFGTTCCLPWKLPSPASASIFGNWPPAWPT